MERMSKPLHQDYKQSYKQIKIKINFKKIHFVIFGLTFNPEIRLSDCFQNRNFKYINFDFNNYKFLLINTNIEHNLADSAYNERVKECSEALSVINKKYNKYNSLIEVEENILNEFKSILKEKIYNRALFVIQENQRTHDSANKISNSKLKEFGELMYKSHYGLKNL